MSVDFSGGELRTSVCFALTTGHFHFLSCLMEFYDRFALQKKSYFMDVSRGHGSGAVSLHSILNGVHGV